MDKLRIIKAQGTAFKLLQKYGQLEAAPVELEVMAFAEDLEFEVNRLVGCEARLVRDERGKGFARISNSIKEPGRVRFALAHELGHFLMHVGLSQTRACTSGDMVDYRKDPIEVEANIFAGEVLMPKHHFKKKADLIGPNFEEISEIATIFNVSLTASILRYIDVGPIEEVCLVCVGSDRRVKWCKCREGNWDLWVDPGTLISNRSMAHCAMAAKDNVDATSVNPGIWFQKSHGMEVTEQCVYMADYNAVLSLLLIERD